MKRGRNTKWAAAMLSGVFVMTVAAGTATAQQSGGGGGQQGGGGGQQGGGGTGGGQQGGGTTPAPGGQQTPRPGQQQQQQQFPGQQGQRPGDSIDMMERPVYLSGKVMLDDGTAPQEQVIVELLCGGVPRPIGYTDSKGRFSVDLNRSSTMMMPDASVSDTGFPGMGGNRGRSMGGPGGGGGGIRETDLRGCDLRASFPGFRSDQINLTGRRAFDNPDIGTIVLHRLGSVEGFTYSMTSAAAPKDAKKAYEKGIDQIKKKKWPEAEEQLRKAVTEYPKYATAWFELGRSLEAQKKTDEAKTAYQQALTADEKYVNPYLHLMTIVGREKKWEEAAEMSGKVIKLNPFSFPQAYYINGVAQLNLNNLDAAEKSAREAVKLDPDHRLPRATHLLGIILAEKKDYPGALEQMRGFLMVAPNAPDVETVKKQIGELERIVGGTSAATPQQQ